MFVGSFAEQRCAELGLRQTESSSFILAGYSRKRVDHLLRIQPELRSAFLDARY
jgi:hypothetical protein